MIRLFFTLLILTLGYTWGNEKPLYQNGELIMLPSHAVKLHIDRKDVFYIEGIPYVIVDGICYQIDSVIEENVK